MATGQMVLAVASRIPSGIVFRDEIFPRPGPFIAQGAADNLFDLAVVEIDAWTKFCHRARQTNHYDAANSSTK
jgi:hypothetical protein